MGEGTNALTSRPQKRLEGTTGGGRGPPGQGGCHLQPPKIALSLFGERKSMPASIPGFSTTPQALWSLIGTGHAPVIIDVCIDEDFSADPRLIPGAIRRAHKSVAEWAHEFAGRNIVVTCQKGQKLSQGAAAILRASSVHAQFLIGGQFGWHEAGLPSMPSASLPARTAQGHTLWVTRERPKIDRIACPWLIRRFVDPAAVFLFVEPAQVEAVADKFGATPFDVEGVFWSHRGDTCAFDTMIAEFGLASPALARLALIVRGADTGRLDLAPESAGLLAVSLGLSRLYTDDLAQLAAGLGLYDALYLWCRDGTHETHNWPVAARASA